MLAANVVTLALQKKRIKKLRALPLKITVVLACCTFHKHLTFESKFT